MHIRHAEEGTSLDWGEIIHNPIGGTIAGAQGPVLCVNTEPPPPPTPTTPTIG